jgi:hypothetical protein
MQDAYGNISGPVYQLPAGPLNGAFGFEYRTDGINDIPDAMVAQGDGATFSLPTQGSYSHLVGLCRVEHPDPVEPAVRQEP